MAAVACSNASEWENIVPSARPSADAKAKESEVV